MDSKTESNMEQSNIPNQPRLHSTVTPTPIVGEAYETLSKLNEDGSYELSILVSGVHCAGCIQKIESSLQHDHDIQTVRLNFSTRRLLIVWKGAPQRANDFVHIVEALGYGVQPYDTATEIEETNTQERFLLLCLGVAGFAMGNVMLLSVGVWSASSEVMGVATRDLMHWVSALIALPTILFSGRPFFRSAFKALSVGRTNMDVPISLALILAGGMSLFETINHGEHVYFDSAVMLIFFLLIGRYLDFRARKNARSAATDLLSTLSGFASVVEGDKTRHVLIRDVQPDMIVRVASGEKFPVDGLVIDGQSEVDTSLITGETMPRIITKNAQVFAGTLNLSAPMSIKVARAAEDSLLADIVRLMEKAGQGQSKYVRLADKAAEFYTPAVHSFAALAFLGWWLVGGLSWQPSMVIAITVLIITCPCALGLAVPVVQVLASGRLLKNGTLIKSGDALERLASIDTVLLDKTGTLTLGKPLLDKDHNEVQIKMAASLAGHSSHPLSKALSAAYEGPLFSLAEVAEHPGQGLVGVYDGKAVKLGSRSYCGDEDAAPSDKLELWLSIEGQAPQAYHFTDRLREGAAQMVQQFKQAGLTVIMLSGDRQSVAEKIALEAGIDQIYAEQTPPQKFEVLERLQRQGGKVLMIGDGLNDAPVLAGADVSMAPGTAIDMAQNAADIIFMGDNIAPVYSAYQTARLSQKLVKQNFALAVVYNIITVPLALAGLVTPLIAAIAMSGSSLVVIANSFRLRLSS
jgi:Cu2+-exporting ATPase